MVIHSTDAKKARRKMHATIACCAVAIVAAVISIAGCGSPSRPPPTLAPRVGMTDAEVRTALGKPDVTFRSEFGEETADGKWIGMVWIYFYEQDPQYEHAVRRLKNAYIFYPPESPMLLNHWELDVPVSPTRQSKPPSRP